MPLYRPGTRGDATREKLVRESNEEKRYRKLLLSGMDLSKDFIFSYTYCLSRTLQTNLTSTSTKGTFDSMFVWNDFLTRYVPGCN